MTKVRYVRCDNIDCGKTVMMEHHSSLGSPGYWRPPKSWEHPMDVNDDTHFCSEECYGKWLIWRGQTLLDGGKDGEDS